MFRELFQVDQYCWLHDSPPLNCRVLAKIAVWHGTLGGCWEGINDRDGHLILRCRDTIQRWRATRLYT